MRKTAYRAGAALMAAVLAAGIAGCGGSRTTSPEETVNTAETGEAEGSGEVSSETGSSEEAPAPGDETEMAGTTEAVPEETEPETTVYVPTPEERIFELLAELNPEAQVSAVLSFGSEPIRLDGFSYARLNTLSVPEELLSAFPEEAEELSRLNQENAMPESGYLVFFQGNRFPTYFMDEAALDQGADPYLTCTVRKDGVYQVFPVASWETAEAYQSLFTRLEDECLASLRSNLTQAPGMEAWAAEAVAEGEMAEEVAESEMADETMESGMTEEAMETEMASEAMETEMASEAMETEMASEAMETEMASEAMETEMASEAMETEMTEEAMETEMASEAMETEMASEAMETETAGETMESEMTEEAMETEMTEETMAPEEEAFDPARLSNELLPLIREYRKLLENRFPLEGSAQETLLGDMKVRISLPADWAEQTMLLREEAEDGTEELVLLHKETAAEGGSGKLFTLRLAEAPAEGETVLDQEGDVLLTALVPETPDCGAATLAEYSALFLQIEDVLDTADLTY